MAKGPRAFEVHCPCCGAMLKVDAQTKAVIAHTPPPEARTYEDFDAAARALRDRDDRRESLFRQSVEAEKNKASLLEQKFKEALKRAKDSPDTGRPIRDIDLD